MLNYEVRLIIRKEDLQIIGIYVLVIKPKVSDKLLYEDFFLFVVFFTEMEEGTQISSLSC